MDCKHEKTYYCQLTFSDRCLKCGAYIREPVTKTAKEWWLAQRPKEKTLVKMWVNKETVLPEVTRYILREADLWGFSVGDLDFLL